MVAIVAKRAQSGANSVDHPTEETFIAADKGKAFEATVLIATLNRRAERLDLPSAELSADLSAASPLHTCLQPSIVLG